MDIKNASLEKLKAMAFDVSIQRRSLMQQDQQFQQQLQAIENVIAQKVASEQKTTNPTKAKISKKKA